MAIQRRLAEHRRAHGFAPSVRIGVHADEAARHGAGFAGRGVHVAARIGALAEGGEILASASTVAAAPDLTKGEPRTVELKGLSDPVELIAVSWQ